MTSQKTLMFILPAFGAALIAVLSQIIIPFGSVPFTLQTLGVGLIATLFKRREALLSVFLYLLLGGIGLPVFAGGTAGLASLLGPTAGFLWGFLLYAGLTASWLIPEKSIWQIFLINLAGDSLVFLFGTFSLHFFAQMDWQVALLAGTMPFLIPELIKLTMIALFSKPIFASLKSTTYFQK